MGENDSNGPNVELPEVLDLLTELEELPSNSDEQIDDPNLVNTANVEVVEFETLEDILSTPFAGGFKDAYQDILITDVIPLDKRWKRLLANDAVLLASFGLTTVPHELIHAGVNIATGGTNEEIVINKLFGGSLAEKLIPGVDADWLLPFIGGYVKPETMSTFGEYIVPLAPYGLTPLGIYLVAKGRNKGSLPITALGIGAIAGHLGGVIGDWWNIGRTFAYDCMEGVSNFTGGDLNLDNPTVQMVGGVAGFYLGLKALGFTYRLSKWGVRKTTGVSMPSPSPDANFQKKQNREYVKRDGATYLPAFEGSMVYTDGRVLTNGSKLETAYSSFTFDQAPFDLYDLIEGKPGKGVLYNETTQKFEDAVAVINDGMFSITTDNLYLQGDIDCKFIDGSVYSSDDLSTEIGIFTLKPNRRTRTSCFLQKKTHFKKKK